MGRGKAAESGATRTSQNGYHYTKVENDWRLTHHLTAEKKLGRPLNDNEIVKLGGKGKKFPYDESNVEVIIKRTSSLRKRKAQIESRIADLQAELDSVNKAINNHAEA
jgi:hypothetical protein